MPPRPSRRTILYRPKSPRSSPITRPRQRRLHRLRAAVGGGVSRRIRRAIGRCSRRRGRHQPGGNSRDGQLSLRGRRRVGIGRFAGVTVLVRHQVARRDRLVTRFEVDVAVGRLRGAGPAPDRRGVLRKPADVLVDADGMAERLADLVLLVEESDDLAPLVGELGKLLEILLDGDRFAAFPATPEIDEEGPEQSRATKLGDRGARQSVDGTSEMLRRPARLEFGEPFAEHLPVRVGETRKPADQLFEDSCPFIHADGSRLEGNQRISHGLRSLP